MEKIKMIVNKEDLEIRAEIARISLEVNETHQTMPLSDAFRNHFLVDLWALVQGSDQGSVVVELGRVAEFNNIIAYEVQINGQETVYLVNMMTENSDPMIVGSEFSTETETFDFTSGIPLVEIQQQLGLS